MTQTNTNMPQHIAEFEKALAKGRCFGTEAPADAAQIEESLRSTIPEDMIRQVTNRMQFLQSRLAEHRGFDKQGKPEYVLPANDHRRNAFETELHFLKTHTLPATQQRAAQVAAAKAALPTLDQKLRAEVDRNQRIHAAAVAKADDLEIEEMARRILATRRHAGGRAAT